MVKAEIKLSDGSVVSVDGSVSEVKRLVEFFNKNAEKKKRLEKKSSSKGGTASIIRSLIEAGYFKQERSISEIAREMGARGYPLELMYLSPLLLQMVRTGELKRAGERGRYKYIV
jgi:hypothetical protein